MPTVPVSSGVRRPAPDAVKQADRGQWITVGPGKREWPYKL